MVCRVKRYTRDTKWKCLAFLVNLFKQLPPRHFSWDWIMCSGVCSCRQQRVGIFLALAAAGRVDVSFHRARRTANILRDPSGRTKMPRWLGHRVHSVKKN